MHEGEEKKIVADVLKATNDPIAAVPMPGEHPTEQDYQALVEHVLENNHDTAAGYPLREEMAAMPSGLAVLRTLMDQYNLTTADFQDEIGSTSMVSRVLNGERQLNINYIKKLAARFGVSPLMFIS